MVYIITIKNLLYDLIKSFFNDISDLVESLLGKFLLTIRVITSKMNSYLVQSKVYFVYVHFT